jgi:hypothetical protein
VPWLESIKPEDYDVFSATETEKFYLKKEKAFTKKYKRKKTNIKSLSFRKF